MEFALVAPVLLAMMMQIFNLGQMVYGKVVLSGAIAQASRDSSLETANTASSDALVLSIVSRVLPNATVTGRRSSYYDFADIGRPEKWNDTDGNGDCNGGEAYVDENRNGNWDREVGSSGNGGAGDVVIYTVTVTYVPVFPVPFAPGSWKQATISASEVRKNQPFANQTAYGVGAGTCT